MTVFACARSRVFSTGPCSEELPRRIRARRRSINRPVFHSYTTGVHISGHQRAFVTFGTVRVYGGRFDPLRKYRIHLTLPSINHHSPIKRTAMIYTIAYNNNNNNNDVFVPPLSSRRICRNERERSVSFSPALSVRRLLIKRRTGIRVVIIVPRSIVKSKFKPRNESNNFVLLVNTRYAHFG